MAVDAEGLLQWEAVTWGPILSGTRTHSAACEA